MHQEKPKMSMNHNKQNVRLHLSEILKKQETQIKVTYEKASIKSW